MATPKRIEDSSGHRSETRGFTLWLTGLSGSGKSTLAKSIRTHLVEENWRVEILDGDEIRASLNPELGFTKADRNINVHRIAYIANLLSRNGIVAIVAAISPYRAARREARRMHEGRFIEVHVDCGVDELIRRDSKGLYAKAVRGELGMVTGISDIYQKPNRPDIRVHTDMQTVDESSREILTWLVQNGLTQTCESTRTTGQHSSEDTTSNARLVSLYSK